MLPPLSSTDRWKFLATCCLSFVIALSVAAAGYFTVMSPVKQTVLKFDSQPSWAGQSFRWSNHLSGEWTLADSGLILQPHRHGTFETVLSNKEHGGLTVLLFGHGGQGFRLAVSVSEDGTNFRTVHRSTSLENQIRLDLSADTLPLSRVWLRLSASNEASSGTDSDALLSRIRMFVVPPDQSLINIPILVLVALIPPLAFLTRYCHSHRGALLFSFLIQGGVILLIWGATAQQSFSLSPAWEFDSIVHKGNLYLAIVYAFLIGVMGWQVRRAHDARAWQITWECLALGGVLCLGAMNRLDALLFTSWDSLLPDALDYKQLAEALHSPLETGAREPLWVWMIAGWFALTEPSGLSLRLFSLMMSIVLLVMTYLFIRNYTQQPTLALLVATLMAFNPFLVHLSVEGIRDEIFTATVMVVLYLVLMPHIHMSFPVQIAGLSLACAASLLLRFNSYTFLLPLLAVWAWRQERLHRMAVVIPVLSLVLVAIPVLEHNARQFGDPMHLVNVHSRWARNQEFVIMKQTGCAGCPSREEFALDGYAGPAITATDYFFRLHSLQDLFEGTVQGFLDVYARPTDSFAAQTGTHTSIGYVLYLIGFCTLILSPHRALLAIIILIANVVPFLIWIGLSIRLLTHTIPFATLILAYGIWWPCHRLFLAFTHSSWDHVCTAAKEPARTHLLAR
jgi:dolichyl-phosphate-mannose-protein mannosyltransferase